MPPDVQQHIEKLNMPPSKKYLSETERREIANALLVQQNTIQQLSQKLIKYQKRVKELVDRESLSKGMQRNFFFFFFD